MSERTLAHYRIEEPLGAGGMGEVYRARDLKLDRAVALKMLPPNAPGDGVARFEREARAIAALNHPGIVHVYSVEESDGVHFITMELVEGQTLDAAIPGHGLSIPGAISLGIGLADALSAAHREGVIHRDLKPSNVMITADGRVKVLDFGLAKLSRGAAPDAARTAITADGFMPGTVPYMSPEQLQGLEATEVSDIFALGVVLYEMTCGMRPFDGVTPAETSSRILRDNPDPVTSRRPDAPYDLGRIIARCLQRRPDRRFQTATDVRNELEELARLLDREPESRRPATPTGAQTVAENEFVLTADVVRRLRERHPEMIGGSMTWLENEVDSDVLAFFVHGMAQDQRRFADTLRMLPMRGVAPSLYGWDFHARHRPALSLDDHSVLLRALFQECVARLQPRRILLVGFSSGADHVVRMAISAEGPGVDVDGVLVLGGNVDLSSCFYSGVCAELDTKDPEAMLAQIKEVGAGIGSLRDWLTLQKYVVESFLKFGTDVETIKRYGRDIVEPFERRGEDQFIEWYRRLVARVPVVRFVMTEEDFPVLDRILARHLDENVLGDDYREDTIVREDTSHVGLSDADYIIRHTIGLLNAIDTQSGAR